MAVPLQRHEGALYVGCSATSMCGVSTEILASSWKIKDVPIDRRSETLALNILREIICTYLYLFLISL